MDKLKNKPKEELKLLGKKVTHKLEKKENPYMEFPVRGLSNVSYDKKSKTLKLGDSISKRYFFNVAHSKKFLQTVEVASICKNLLEEGKHASLRDVFYMVKRTIPNTKINLVDEQTETDKAIEDLELITEFSREQLYVNANKMGSVVGKVKILDRGDAINWAKLGSGGWSIPSNVEDIKFEEVKANFVVYMEKQAIWERLHEDRVWEKLNCILVTSQGQTTRGIRRLLQRLCEEFKLPVYVLTDFDPWGFYIYSVIKYGSISLAHMSEKMAISGVKFLGIMADDIDKYGLSKHLIKLNEKDITRLKQMVDYEWFKDNKEWQKEFAAMKKLGSKAEIQALSARGISFISEKYLPEKIKNKDFID
ncbi:DNA topoisomerase IV subunit A [Candidatus Woesearchaeota archaeon]|nr:DNA topoisomerase IV subunit A [Candidatus Woesearchaeota archaeon]